MLTSSILEFTYSMIELKQHENKLIKINKMSSCRLFNLNVLNVKRPKYNILRNKDSI